jgi:hypothetical protein
MQHARPNRVRRAVICATLATLLGVVSLTLSQCTMVGDNLTGVGLNKKAQATCIKACNDQNQLLVAQENRTNQTNIMLCAGDTACLAAEAARHTAALAALAQAKTDCKAACKHQQGAGGAG